MIIVKEPVQYKLESKVKMIRQAMSFKCLGIILPAYQLLLQILCYLQDIKLKFGISESKLKIYKQ